VIRDRDTVREDVPEVLQQLLAFTVAVIVPCKISASQTFVEVVADP